MENKQIDITKPLVRASDGLKVDWIHKLDDLVISGCEYIYGWTDEEGAKRHQIVSILGHSPFIKNDIQNPPQYEYRNVYADIGYSGSSILTSLKACNQLINSNNIHRRIGVVRREKVNNCSEESKWEFYTLEEARKLS